MTYYYIRQRTKAEVAEYFKTYPGKSEYFGAIPVFPHATGPGEGVSAWVNMAAKDCKLMQSLNTALAAKWATMDREGAIYLNTNGGNGATMTQARFFTAAFSGNVIYVGDVVGNRARMIGLDNGTYTKYSMNRNLRPDKVSHVTCFWTDGRISEPPAGVLHMPAPFYAPNFDPAYFSSRNIKEMWIDLKWLIPVDRGDFYNFTAPKDYPVYLDPETLELAGSPTKYTKMTKGQTVPIWKEVIGQYRWALTDYGWINKSL